MVYKTQRFSKKYTPRKGKGGYRRRRASTNYSRRSLDKYVTSKVQHAVKKASRGPARSVPVNLIPALFDRDQQIPSIDIQDRWMSYFEGPSSARKYAILPISELIPTQRPAAGEADDRFRSLDVVHVKGVSIRMTINHAEGVRLLVFAFRNGMRRDIAPSSGTRPYVDRASISDPPVKGKPVAEVVYDIMSKEQLMGMNGSGQFAFRNLGVHDGPFDVTRQLNGNFEWKGTDLSAFTSRFSKHEGRPIGTVYAKLDGGASKKHGKTFKGMFGTSSLMRTNAFDGMNPNVSGWIGSRTRQVELFIKLDRREKFTVSNGSLSVNERPVELFMGFDSPGSMHAGTSTRKNIASGAIMAMDMEVYYE